MVLYYITWGLPGGASNKEPICQCRRHKRYGYDPWVRKIPWRRAWQPTSVFLPGEYHGQRSLVGYKSTGSQRIRCNWSDLAHTHTRYHLYMESKIQQKWTYLWSRYRFTDIENRLIVTKGKWGGEGMEWKFGVADTAYTGQINKKALLYIQYPVIN